MSGGLSSSHFNKVHESVSAHDKCKNCGKKGPGKQPCLDLRKDSCPAFGRKKCKNCSILDHFSEQCKKKSKDSPEEHHKPSAKQHSINQDKVVIKKMKMKPE